MSQPGKLKNYPVHASKEETNTTFSELNYSSK
jgi:hypothetical protein